MVGFTGEVLLENPLCREDGATTAIFTTFNNIFVFAMVTNIVTLYSSRLFLVHCFWLFQQLLPNYYQVSTDHFLLLILQQWNTVNVLSKHYMIVSSKAVLLNTITVQPDACNIMEAWFYVVTSFPIFQSDWNMASKMPSSKSWHVRSHFQQGWPI